MTLITVPECEPCKEVKKYIADKDINVEVVEVKKYNGKYMFLNFELPSVGVFPILFFGVDKDQKPNYLIGKEGILSYLKSGFVYAPTGRNCPHRHRKCIEKKCAKFSIFYKGLIPEGGCSDYWTPILMTELISR